MNTPPRIATLAALLLLLPGTARPQGTAPVNFEGLADAIAAAAVLSGAIVYMVRYNKRNVTGCVQTIDGVSTMLDQHTKRRYTLAGTALQDGRQLHLKGIRIKARDGSLTFLVRKISRDYGACKP